MADAAERATTRLMARLDSLAGCTDGPGLTRLYLSPAHATAIRLVAGWMRDAGLTVRQDAAATLIGERAGSHPGAPKLLVGSHLDTVRQAGRYDGAFGVLAGLAALELLRDEGARLPFAVSLLGFGDEEGVRFPVTLTGSRALAGTLDGGRQRAALDADGVSLRDALAAFGGDPDGLDDAGMTPAPLGFIEPHIEQGPVLQSAGLALGVVSAINGATRARITVTGEAGHAGTVPMAGRRDALAAAAEMIVAIRRLGGAAPDVTATVGQIAAEPGAVNVIPGRAVFTLDLRAPCDPVRETVWQRIRAALADVATAQRVQLEVVRTHDAAAAACDPALQAALERAAASVGASTLRLPSGAGHDAMAMAALCPMAMLFVRCRDGISHHPAEHVEAADAEVAVRVLAALLRDLGAAGRGHGR